MRTNIKLSDYIAKKLTLWAALHGRTPGVFASQILSSRVEANFDLIEKQLEEAARYRGITVEELEIQLLQEAKSKKDVIEDIKEET
jgi:predicted transcriptional regulator